MKRTFRAAVSALAIVTLAGSASGCYGKFNLVRTVYNWNGSLDNKFVRSLVYFALVVVPVYEVSAFADWAVFNLIEFWTGNNPVSVSETGKAERVVERDGKTLKLSVDEGGEHLRMSTIVKGEVTSVLDLRLQGDAATVTDGKGTLLATIVPDADGVEVRSAKGGLIAARSAAQLAALGSALREGPQALAAAVELQSGSRVAAR